MTQAKCDRLLSHAPDVFHEAFWLSRAHAGLRLPGEALGIRWGAVDFSTGILHPYDNWVREQLDTTKTAESEAIPMTPRLNTIKQRGYATSDADLVFIDQLGPSRATIPCERPSTAPGKRPA
jgi:integrase